MKKFLFLFLVFSTIRIVAQTGGLPQAFPQTEINKTSLFYRNTEKFTGTTREKNSDRVTPSIAGMLHKMRELNALSANPPSGVLWAQSHDTIFVGTVPHDTL